MYYLDNAATTYVDTRVVGEMLPYYYINYGNPSSIYDFSGSAKDAIKKSRKEISKVIGCKPDEIYFTSGGTESDNWALKGIFEAHKEKGNHIITTKIEHHAILHTAEYLEKERGAKITYLDVDEEGLVSPEAVEAAITPETILISVMTANNEIGTIEPIKEIGAIAKKHGILFHTDAVQAFGHIPIQVDNMNIDLLSASGHKIHAPKGVGFLYIRKGVKIEPLIHGGGQENGMRAGTENVPGIVGFGKAANIALKTMDERINKETDVRNHMMKRILTEIPQAQINGSIQSRLPNNINVSFKNIPGSSLVLMLNNFDIYVSSGSACASSSLKPSHVLKAIGLSDEEAESTIRLTINKDLTIRDADYVVDCLKQVVQSLRE